ncbi:hypothetical protein EJ994_04920 [Maribacter sp. MJ134]|jgi:hypothetical protein|uniref:hypothetical protein n=1 Tax=Maribacter sp. MJ134 TaxID=2496865 RepID=UPI000F83ECBF|nr:hypothetical protein [Maribacter sp. MJ134]AZQ58182.1 hypothetical protein EJ994_04920 [Maribacter sp. MJ134]
MNTTKVTITWKLALVLSISILLLLDFSNFYGLYSNRFYVFKVDNYIIPILSLIHFSYLYQFWHKVKENLFGSPKMRNLEYSLYILLLVYCFKFFDTLFIILSYFDYENSLFPKTFFPVGLSILVLYASLIVLTLLIFGYRKELIGTYLFDDMNQHVDHWN